MEAALDPLLPALLWQAGNDIDYQGMALWARLTIDIAMLLLGAVLGAAGANTYHLRRARFAQQALSPAERQAVARHLALTGQAGEAQRLSGPPPPAPPEHSTLLALLEAEERAAVAARLRVAGLSFQGRDQDPGLEPRARDTVTSREAAEQMRAEAQARRARQLGVSIAELARLDQRDTSASTDALQAQPPGPAAAAVAESAVAAPVAGAAGGRIDAEALAALWRAAAQAFEAWVKSPPEGWLAALQQPQGPAGALDSVEEALRAGGIDPDSPFPQAPGRAIATVLDELRIARRVIADTQNGLAPLKSARERSLQIASTAQYALGELRESAALAERLVIEDKLARL